MQYVFSLMGLIMCLSGKIFTTDVKTQDVIYQVTATIPVFMYYTGCYREYWSVKLFINEVKAGSRSQ